MRAILNWLLAALNIYAAIRLLLADWTFGHGEIRVNTAERIENQWIAGGSDEKRRPKLVAKLKELTAVAYKDYKAAMKLNPLESVYVLPCERPMHNLASLLTGLARLTADETETKKYLSEAEDVLRKYIPRTLWPDHGYILLADVYLMQGERAGALASDSMAVRQTRLSLHKALDCYEKALEINPAAFPHYLRVAEIYDAIGWPEKAEANREMFKKWQPQAAGAGGTTMGTQT